MNNFAELLITKLCHDMAGPISAVHNGLEFMMMEAPDMNDPGEKEMQNKAIELVQVSSAQSLARLQAYRMAYGMVRGASDASVGEVKEILRNYFYKSNVKIHWDNSIPEKVSSALRRVIVSMVLVTSKVIIYGGDISIKFENSNGFTKAIVQAVAPRIKDPKDLLEALTGNVEATLENVVPLFLKSNADKEGISLNAASKEESGNKIIELIAGYKTA